MKGIFAANIDSLLTILSEFSHTFRRLAPIETNSSPLRHFRWPDWWVRCSAHAEVGDTAEQSALEEIYSRNGFNDESESMSEGFVENDGGGFVEGLGSAFVRGRSEVGR